MRRTFWLLGLVSVLTAGSVRGRVVLLTREGRVRTPLTDVVVLLEPLQASLRVSPRPALRIKTEGKTFVPRVSITTPGSDVTFPNLDHILHNVFSVTAGNAFDTGHYIPGDSPTVRVRQPGLVKLYCNVHSQMNAFLWVVDTPWAKVLQSAEVAFDTVPAGRYRLRVWHPEAGERTWTLEVGEGITTGTWELQADRAALEPHKNKFGKDYPPHPDERVY